MPILKLTIDKLTYEVQCKKGEEGLLKNAEDLINSKIEENKHLESLSQSKKFLMVALFLAAELNSLKKKTGNDLIFDEILNELNLLEKVIEKND